MAKITHFKNPIDPTEIEVLETNVTIREALYKLNLDKTPVGIKINGLYDTELDLDYKPNPEDVIEIRHEVEGGGNSSTKSTLATIVQIAAIVVASFFTGGAAAAILLAGAAVSAVLNKWAKDLAGGEASGDSVSETDTATNSFSLSSSANQARPTQPVALLLGKHRMVPDIQADSLRFNYGYPLVPTTSPTPSSTTFYPGITAANSPNSVNNSWISMPKNYIAPGFPKYNIKIAPYGFGIVPGTSLTPTENTFYCDKVKSKYLGMTHSHINWTFSDIGPSSKQFYPLVIYHSDNTDPAYQKYNLFHFIARTFQLNLPYSTVTDMFLGIYGIMDFRRVAPVGYFYAEPYIKSGGLFTRYYFNSTYPPIVALGNVIKGSVNSGIDQTDADLNALNQLEALNLNTNATFRSQAQIIGTTYYPVSIPNSVSMVSYYQQWGTWLRNVLNGNTAHAGNTNFAIETHYIVSAYGPFINESKLASTQIFNFGVGDLDIKDNRVENTEIGSYGFLPPFGASANGGFYPQYIGQDGSLPTQSQYIVPYRASMLEIGDTVAYFSPNIKRYDNKRLTCSDGYPTTIVSLADEGQYNFILYRGKRGQNAFRFHIVGQLYGTSQTTGFVNNTCRIEVHYRKVGDPQWQYLNYVGIIDLTNNTTKKVTVSVDPSPESFYYTINDPFTVDDMFEFRIRKVTPDSTTNATNQICDLNIVDVSFYTMDGYYMRTIRDRDCTIPSNLMGLLVTSNLTDQGQTNKYSAYVEASCYRWDVATETWIWGKTSNPAWWFLYYAHGGFINRPSAGVGSYPTSPTYGWQNYPGLPDNEYHVFGGGLTDDQIDIEKIKEWAVFCDDNELSCNMVVKDDTSVSDMLERIANTGRASSTYYKGILSVHYESGEQIPTAMYGMSNIVAGSFTVDYAVSDMPRKVKANFINGETWESEQVEALVPFSDEDNLKEVEVQLEGVTDPDLAQRAVNLLAARQYYQRRTYKWSVDIEGLIAKRGELVYLSHDSTQYGWSGRIVRFNIESGVVLSIETTAILDDSIGYVTIKNPYGTLKAYECHVENNKIIFDSVYFLEDAPFYYSDGLENPDSQWNKSIPEDFIFIAGDKETPGKIVRISMIEAGEDFKFNITAVDEDAAMWGYEFNEETPETSFDDSTVVLEVKNLKVNILSNGLVKINWEGSEFIQIINTESGLPVESNGGYSFTNGEASITLTPNHKFVLEIKPFAIGTPYKSVSETITVWPR